jgi:DMSO/TMAO reductase YedYZ molybdopterin-dependent catalytic subunit
MVANVLPAGLVLAAGIAERARGLLPLEVMSFLIVRLKFAAKPVGLWTSMAAVAVAAAAFGGLWGARSRHPAVAGLGAAVAAGLGLAAVAGRPAMQYLEAILGAQGADRPEAQALRLLAGAVGSHAALAGVAFVLGLRLLPLRRAPAGTGAVPPVSSGPSEAASDDVNRREFMVRSVLLAGAWTGVGALAQWVRAVAAQAAPAVSSIFQRVQGLPPEITPNSQFYVISKNAAGLDPRLDAARWSLDISGLVGRPIRLSHDEIKAMPSISRYHTLECISNEVGGDLIGNAMWKGVRFRDLIARAGGVSPRAVRFALRCADGYSEGIPVADAMQPEVMLAYEMNGEPLPPAHGFPVRMLIPGLFGMKNPKWLTRIEAVSTHFTGYWQASGWSDEAVVQTMSAFTTPAGGVALGEVELGGWAYSGDRGIALVEVSSDGGRTWSKTEVKPALGPHTWVLWAAIWRPTAPGEYTLKVRAQDGTGVTQTARESPPLPDGATGYHTIRVRVRR